MFLTTHAAAGMFIAEHVHNPLAVFGLSFASHFVLDIIPHGDEHLFHDEEWQVQKRYRRVIAINAVDVSLLIGLSLWVIGRPDLPSSHLLLIGILGGILPDLLSMLFPVIHERLSWLSLVRWIYSLTKPTGLRYFVRVQNRIHTFMHDKIIQRDIPFWLGLVEQAALIIVLLFWVR